jgi:hypothetical protein
MTLSITALDVLPTKYLHKQTHTHTHTHRREHVRACVSDDLALHLSNPHARA